MQTEEIKTQYAIHTAGIRKTGFFQVGDKHRQFTDLLSINFQFLKVAI
jgi:hypothetical protein